MTGDPGAVMRGFPVISLWQPYASLIFAGVKKHETRSRPFPLKYTAGIVAIHATAKFPPLKKISEDLHLLCMDVFGCSYNFSLPQGAILGTVRLLSWYPTDQHSPFDDDDKIAGDWSSGRFAWSLGEVTKLAEPIPAKGAQGWWRHSLATHSAPGSPVVSETQS